MNNYLNNHKRGAALLIVVIFFFSITLSIILGASLSVVTELHTYRTLVLAKRAYVAAEASIEDALYRTVTEKILTPFYTLVLNESTSTLTSVTISDTEKQFYAVGNAQERYRQIYLRASKTYRVSLPYGAQAGEGGITLGNNATIDAMSSGSGNVYSNGPIVGGSGVTIFGDAIVSSGIFPDMMASSTLCQSDVVIGQSNPQYDVAQSFVIATTSQDRLAKVQLYIKRVGNPTGANIRITSDAGGRPATTALATQAFSYATAGTNYSWVEVIFSNPPTLNPATTYWVVVDYEYNNSRHIVWCRSNADTYGTGLARYSADWSSGTS